MSLIGAGATGGDGADCAALLPRKENMMTYFDTVIKPLNNKLGERLKKQPLKIWVNDESSTYVYAPEWDDAEMVDGKEVWHLAFRCQHDHLMLGDEGVYCPDCENKHLTIGEADKKYQG